MASLFGLAAASSTSVDQSEPIALRFSARSPDGPKGEAPETVPKDAREEFWTRIQGGSANLRSLTLDQLEAKLLREFPRKLKDKLVEHCTEPLEVAGSLPDAELIKRFERLLRNSEADDYHRNRVFEELATFMSLHSDRLKDSVLEAAKEKLAAAGSLVFVVRIEKYQSLTLTLLIGSIESLARVFDSNAFNLQLFLEAFASVALADVFGQQAFDAFASSVTIPESLASALASSASARAAPPARDAPETQSGARGIAQRQAQGVWRLATTTWLLPVALALVATYYAAQELRSISALRERVLAPIIEHQAQLLREDRLRLMTRSDSAR